jgi:SAM-dependent methyltransferase
LNQILQLNHREFVEAAYRFVLHREPSPDECASMLGALIRGDTKSSLLAALRYCAEGRARAVVVDRSFRHRHLLQRGFGLRGVGPLLERLATFWRLPASLRLSRAMEQWLAGEVLDQGQAIRAMNATRGGVAEGADTAGELARLQRRMGDLVADIARLERAQATANAREQETRARLQAIDRPSLGDTLEVVGAPLHARARQVSGISDGVPTSALSPDTRYALFENAFYDSAIVAVKQRVYLPYLDRDLTQSLPFLDLGCGRGEFLRILRGEQIDVVGVDTNATALAALRSDGFEVHEQDLLAFLQTDTRTYSGAAALQVAEHLDAEQIERMLALLAPRLATGAILIVETPNPLSPFALGQFHTDPTHIAPLPPERLRFTVEAAGFDRSRTLFQARIPLPEFAGPDARAYYMDYAVIAYRCTS